VFVFHHPLQDTGKGEGGIDNGEVTHTQLVLHGGGESDEWLRVMRNCVKIKPRVEQGITYFLANGHPQVLWQAKVWTGGKPEGWGESAVVSQPGHRQAQDQTKEHIVPFITWRISLLQLLACMHHTDPQLSTAKRQHRTRVLNATHSQTALHQYFPMFTFCTFCTCHKQKKYQFWRVPPTWKKKSLLLFSLLFLLFSYFLYFSAYFLHKIYLNFTFFLLLHILYQSTFFTNPASKKKSRGDYFFYFSAKKYKKVKKSMKSKHRDLLMLSICLPSHHGRETHLELEMLLCVHDTIMEHLEADHHWLAECGQEERKKKEHLSKEREKEKVSGKSCHLHFVEAQQTK
jgi:hypothetical protein